jgi:hypothetical protein
MGYMGSEHHARAKESQSDERRCLLEMRKKRLSPRENAIDCLLRLGQRIFLSWH